MKLREGDRISVRGFIHDVVIERDVVFSHEYKINGQTYASYVRPDHSRAAVEMWRVERHRFLPLA